MGKENAIYFLNDSSLDELEASKGATLVYTHKEIQEYQRKINEEEHELADTKITLGERQIDLDKLSQIGFFKRLINYSAIKERKTALINEIAQLSKKVEEIEASLNAQRNVMSNMKRGVNDLYAAIARVGVSPEDVIEEYYRIKAELEEKEKNAKLAEAEKKLEEKAVSETTSSNLNYAAEETQPTEKDKKVERVAPQNRQQKTMSPLERFNARMEKHKVMTGKTENQRGDN